MPGQASKENGKKGGRPKGAKSATTLERERVFAEVRQRIMRKAEKILNAQFSLAEGQQFLYRIDKEEMIGPKGGVSYKSQKPVLVTDPEEIANYLDGEYGDGESMNTQTEYYYITTKEPNNMAIDSMFDRTFDKPKQGVDINNPDGNLKTIIINKHGSNDRPTKETD